MTLRIDHEMARLRQFFPDAEYEGEAHWVRLPHYPLPAEPLWHAHGKPISHVQIATQFPPGFPTNQPYGFYVTPILTLASGAAPTNVSAPSEAIPWEGPWLKFSWQLAEWRPSGDIVTGTTFVDFVLTFADRFRQGA